MKKAKNVENFIAFGNEIIVYIEDPHLFPNKHCRMSHLNNQIYS